MMIGGALLFVFCLFMISLSQPEHFYQVRVFPEVRSSLDLIFSQVYLPQGLGLGTAIGFMYIPAVGVVSQYFHKRRSLAIGLATSVTSLSVCLSVDIYSEVQGAAGGGAVLPILLNTWFYGSVGFHNGVRASAALTGGLLVIAILLIRPRYPEKKKKTQKLIISLRKFSKDIPYVIAVLG